MAFESTSPIITPQDFYLDTEVKWCPGCGGHAVLSAIKKALPETGVSKEKVVFVSGIGCSSRFPYYINAYGFHSLHGRAPAIASGIKVSNPDLSVWIITGDGDSMAIGGNHFIHILRRNIDVNIILFNNKIYGLTKGQYSPTTPIGSITKTSPDGTIENPFLPGELAMGAQGTFYARVVDTNPKMMTEVFIKAAQHKGTSLVEVLQNCIIFNNQVHAEITGKDVRDDNQIYLEHGKPMIFGKNRDKGLIQSGPKFVVVKIGENGIRKEDILVHNVHNPDDTRHYMLSRMTLPDYPVAMGIIREWKTGVYENMLYKQIREAKKRSRIKTVNDLLKSGNTFRID
ncbi:MAG: 2-oxoacid:ferredoxin oxidoreductase subunit beta [Bacteroidales bacterium]|jgi:2-oxoglutarate ferredoxin oxidoreductase subunit beta|nr:2-oxoacid:ferredoxin oxidoreductase subunit beta [Bacteroidales bacterium]